MLFEGGTEMRKSKVSHLWSRGLAVALLLVVVTAGCGRQQAGIAAPTLAAVSPNSGAQGQVVSVTLTGTNFGPGCAIALTGTGIAVSNTVVVSGTEITATFTIDAAALSGARSVTVICPGGTTNAVTFTVLGPTLTSISPDSGTHGEILAVALTGTAFTANCTIGLTGTGIAVSNTVVVSGTQITATFAIDDAAPTGDRDVTVICPNGTTDAVTFAVLDPTLTSISPDSGDQGETLAVTLTGTGFTAGCTIDLTGAGIAVSNTVVVSGMQITATFTISSTAPAGPHSVAVICPGGTTNAVTFTVLGPTLTSISPNSGIQGETLAVALTGTVFSAGCTIGLTGTGITVSNTVVVSSTQITATFAIDEAAPTGDRSVTVICPGGTTSAVTFTVNLLPPTVSSTIPVNGATAVPLNRIITATFSKAMDPATITTTTFLVTGPGLTPVAGTVTYDAASKTATFTPSANLAASTLFTATITTGATDTGGNTLVSGGSAPNPWTFTTGLAADTTAPTVSATNPADTATDVAVNASISATFSEAMDPATINTTTFTVTGPGLTPVAGTVSYAAASNTATFTPSANLAADTLFTATVTTGATDLAGNALAGGGLAPNPWTFTTGSAADTTAPTITLTNPADAATGVAINASVNATFSEAMDPLTITTGTFTLTGPGVTPVSGTVTYDPVSFVATFTPASDLAIDTTFTATVTAGAKDLAGNALVSGLVPNPWTFTTGSTTAGPAPVDLLSAANFAILAGSTVTNLGPTIINGDLGLSPGTAVTGFPPGVVNGTIFVDPDPIVQQAKLDLTTAFNDAAGRSLDVIIVASGELGGLTLAPGLYRSGIASFAITSVDLTLDAQGNANAVWIFQMPSSTLTVGNGRQVILAGGAQAKNIFWSVGSSATIGTTAVVKGNVLADQSITLETGAVLDGRALTRIAAVTLDTNTVTKPAP